MAPGISSSALIQMHGENSRAIEELKTQASETSKTLAELNVLMARMDGKLDRAISLEAKVVQLGDTVGQMKGMGVLATILLGAIEAFVGVYSFFKGR